MIRASVTWVALAILLHAGDLSTALVPFGIFLQQMFYAPGISSILVSVMT